jgi:hypothetical protein
MFKIGRSDGVSLAELQAEIATLPFEKIADKSGTARGENAKEGWINGLEIARVYGPDPEFDSLWELPVIEHVVKVFSQQQNRTIHQVMINKLAAHSALEMHRDGPPAKMRWHLPITTNALVEWYDEIDGWLHMDLGIWHGPVSYCNKLHSMTNDGETERIHLILDLDMSEEATELYERLNP